MSHLPGEILRRLEPRRLPIFTLHPGEDKGSYFELHYYTDRRAGYRVLICLK